MINNDQINYSIPDEVSGNNSQNLNQAQKNNFSVENVSISILDTDNQIIKLDKPVDVEISANEPIKIHRGWDQISEDDEFALLKLSIWREQTDDQWHADIDSDSSIKKITLTLDNVKILDVNFYEDEKKLKLNKPIEYNISGTIPAKIFIVVIDKEWNKLFLGGKIIPNHTLIKKLSLKIWKNSSNTDILNADIIDLEVQILKSLDLKNIKIISANNRIIKLDQDILIEDLSILSNTSFEIYEGWNEKIFKDDEYVFLKLDIWKPKDEYCANIIASHKKSKIITEENIKLNAVNFEKKSIGLNRRIRDKRNASLDISVNEEIKIHKGWDKTFADNDEFALLNLKIWKFGDHFHADIESSSVKKEKVYIQDVKINYINLKKTPNKFYPQKTIKIKLSRSFIYNKNKIDSDTMISINEENWDESIEVEDEFDSLVLNIWENNNNLYADYIENESINKRNISEPEEDLNDLNSKDNNEEAKEPKNSSEDNNEKTESMNDLNNDKIKLKEVNKTLSYIIWKSAIITIFVSIIIIFLIIILFIYMLKIRKKRII